MLSRTGAIKFLEGKTIKSVKHGVYHHWFTIELIEFTDGSKLELSGNADVAIIDNLVSESGEWLDVDLSDIKGSF